MQENTSSKNLVLTEARRSQMSFLKANSTSLLMPWQGDQVYWGAKALSAIGNHKTTQTKNLRDLIAAKMPRAFLSWHGLVEFCEA